MLGKLVKLGGVCFLLVLFGCRTSRPEVKPPPSPEVLSVPPAEARYNNSAYPKQAFADRDQGRMRAMEAPGVSQAGMRGPGGPGGPGGNRNMP